MTDTKTRLLDSAERLARAHGFDGFSFADMASEVEIRKASIHYHFPTKSDLAVALMARYTDDLERHLALFSEQSAHSGEKLAAFIDRYRQGLADASSLCLCVALSISRDQLDEAVVEALRKFRDINQAWLTQVYRDARKDGKISGLTKARPDAAATLALLEGAQIGARAEGSMGRFEMSIRPLTARIQSDH